jgi:hypothetical protein
MAGISEALARGLNVLVRVLPSYRNEKGGVFQAEFKDSYLASQRGFICPG